MPKKGLGITEVRVIDYKKAANPRLGPAGLKPRLSKAACSRLPIYLALAGKFAEKELGKKAVATTARLLRPVRDTRTSETDAAS